MVAFPPGHKRVFPDQETVVMDLLEEPASRLDPPGYVCAWLPDPDPTAPAGGLDEYLAQGRPVIRVARLPGGQVSDSGVLDTGVIQLACFAPGRDDAWAVLDYCEKALFEFTNGGEVTHTDGSVSLVTGVVHDTAPVEQAEVNLDERLAARSYLVTTRKNRG